MVRNIEGGVGCSKFINLTWPRWEKIGAMNSVNAVIPSNVQTKNYFRNPDFLPPLILAFINGKHLIYNLYQTKKVQLRHKTKMMTLVQRQKGLSGIIFTA